MAVDDDLDALSRRLLTDGAGAYLGQVDELKRAVAMGNVDVAARIHAILNGIAGGSIDHAAIGQAIADAYTMAVLDSGAIIANTASNKTFSTIANKAINPPAVSTDDIAVKAYQAAQQAVRLLNAGIDPSTAAAGILGNGTRTKAALNDLLMTHHARGTEDVARITRKPMVWVAERNACVRCLAHSGHVIAAGDKFPGGLTYGPYDYDDEVSKPPLHPHCRCHLEVLNDQGYADALRREADRSILRGYSLESESMTVRVGAAKKLIASGVDAPKGVVTYASKAIKAGEFPTRVVPKLRQGPPDQPRHTPPTPPPAPPKPPTAPRTPPKAPTPPPKREPMPPTPPAPPKREPMPKVAPPAPKPEVAVESTMERLRREAELKRNQEELARVKAERARIAAAQKEADRLGTKIDRSKPIDLSKAKTPKDMAQAVAMRHPKTDWSRWESTTGLNAGQARSAMQTTSDLLDRFPGAILAHHSPGFTPMRGVNTKGVMAWVMRKPLRNEYVNGRRVTVYAPSELEVALGHARSAAKHHEAVQRSSDGGHFHEVKGEDAMRYTITHEFGHVLDNTTEGELSKMWTRRYEAEAAKHGVNGSRERYEWRKTAVSGYGAKNAAEGVAEAFADVEYNGDKALPLNREFHAAAMEWLKIAGIAK